MMGIRVLCFRTTFGPAVGIVVLNMIGCGAPFEATAMEGDAASTPVGMPESSQEPESPVLDATSTPDVNATIPPESSVVEPKESGPSDAPTVHMEAGGVIDAGRMDAARDAPADTGGGCGPTACPPVLFECVPLTAPTGSGLTLSNLFSVGWRFQVPPGRTLTATEVGIEYRPTISTGTLFGAIVPLASGTANPKNTLTPADVLASGIVGPFNGLMPQVVSVPLMVKLPPGWYAVVFGTDQLGASGAQGSIEKMGKVMMCSNGQTPFSLRQTGEFIPQGADPYIFVKAM
jgi:hypothetical protein